MNSYYDVVNVFISDDHIFKMHMSRIYYHTVVRSPISGQAVLLSILVDGRYRVQFPVALVDLVVRSFPWFSPKRA